MPGNGPLPQRTRRRTNAPTIPTTNLPARGRQGPTPRPPSWATLGKAGRAYWKWAWSTPQAAAWGVGQGFEPAVARRAMLEDDLVALDAGAGVRELLDELGLGEIERDAVKVLVESLLRMATGRTTLVSKMLDLDDRLGLTPKARAALRWEVIDDAPAERAPAPSSPPAGVTELDDRRRRLIGAG